MPKNRSEVDRADKEQEIVLAAADLALAEGPEAVTVSNVARRLDLARNAVTWYFPTRDDLLAATFRHLVVAAVANPSGRRRLNGQIEWAAERLEHLRPLYLHLLARVEKSEAIAAVVHEAQLGLFGQLADALRGRVPPDDVETTTALLGVFIEGLLARPRTPGERAALIAQATARLAPEGPSRPDADDRGGESLASGRGRPLSRP